MLLAVLVTLGIAGDLVWQKLRTADSVVSVASTSSVQSATINLFRTPYFQFQADRTWVEVPEVSTPTKFIYRSSNGTLLEHQLTVYVNEHPPKKLAATHVYTVEVDKRKFNEVSGAERHCNSDTEGLKNEPKVITFNQVTFNCDLGSSTFTAFVGLQGGTNEIPIVRPNGETATYAIIYDDVTFSPNANQINSIMKTFQVH